ncbi:MAG: deoxyribonuclease IV [Thermoplasmata archaeon]
MNLGDEMIVGGHMSIGEGFSKIPERASKIGLKSAQVFTKNQRQWISKPLNKTDVEEYIENMKKYNIVITVAHASYLINLAAPEEDKWNKSIESMVHELERCSTLKIPYLIFHPGAHMGKGENFGLNRIVEAIDKIIEKSEIKDVNITLETTAGQGSNLGYKFEHLQYIIENVSDESRINVCLDTCHIFAAGYELRSKNGYDETMGKFENIIGFKKLVAVHLNDSEKGLGSRVDRHAQIGYGYIGREGFKNILSDNKFNNIPLILETPGGEPLYPQDIKVIKEILGDGL